MIRSIYAGVSGMRSHQARMDVIGNNIANVNTTGFKAARVSFADQMSQSVAGAATPTDRRGGANGMQVGLGVTVGAIDMVDTQGNLQTTGKATDLSIEGAGYFVTSDGPSLGYTRAGAFDFDREGTMVNPANGLRVMGWMATHGEDGQPRIDTTNPVEVLHVPFGAVVPPAATTSISARGNLDERLAIGATIDSGAVVYDEVGGKHAVTFRYTHDAANAWSWSVLKTDDMASDPVLTPGADGGSLKFDGQGILAGATPGSYDAGTVAIAFKLPDGGTSTATIKPHFGGSGKTEGVTQFAADASTVVADQDGGAAGHLTGVSVDARGVIQGTFSNGRQEALGQLAIATFSNPGGLKRDGQNRLSASDNSGQPVYRAAGTDEAGVIAPGTLEMSNVDLAQQFSDMILTQRGFQANSRVITASDELLQELINLKR